ncbi:MAG: PDZ domain-containing protein [Planctomycetaceae bacterium]
MFPREFSASRWSGVCCGGPVCFVRFSAARGGLRNRDVILSINEIPVLSPNDLMREIGLSGAGVNARLEVWRGTEGRRLRADVTLGKWPVVDDSQIVATNDRYPLWRGLRVDYPTGRRRFLTSDVMEEYHHAVLILNVTENSPAQAGGLRPGDFVRSVGEVPVETPQQFHEAVTELSGTVTLTRLDGTHIEVPDVENN